MVLGKHPNFLERILGEIEHNQLEVRNFKFESVAASFCAKEALLKVLGMGISGINLKDVQILRDEKGMPFVFLEKSTINKFSLNNVSFSVSITHTKKYASAVVICYKENTGKI